ncbi:MAG TPA: hypothetical protein VEA16_16640 [Vicinamibacterales bacterium]|nr:hypothetical protein [Vicinamibacterales bacterium]
MQSARRAGFRQVAATLASIWMVSGGALAQDPPLEALLGRAAAYVAEYQKRLRGVVAEETYRQNLTSVTRGGVSGRTRTNREHRELRSDVLLVKLPSNEQWLQFRDVFEVDRQPVRDRDQRLYKLFLNAKADVQQQADTIQQESARYNLGPLLRTINIPTMALLFFQKEIQPDITFELEEPGNVRRLDSMAAPVAIRVIKFKETKPGTMVKGENKRDVPSNGRVWIDSVSGRILRTELISVDTDIRALVDVTYKTESALGGLLVPGEMRETYTIRTTGMRIDGRATYGRYRQFTVTTTEKPQP